MRRDFGDQSNVEAEVKLGGSWRGRTLLRSPKDRAEMFTNQPSSV